MEAHLIRIALEALYLVLLLSAPVLLANAAVGLVVGLLQATTQIQEPTVALVPRILTTALTLILAGPWIGQQLIRFTLALFEGLPALAR